MVGTHVVVEVGDEQAAVLGKDQAARRARLALVVRRRRQAVLVHAVVLVVVGQVAPRLAQVERKLAQKGALGVEQLDSATALQSLHSSFDVIITTLVSIRTMVNF